MYRAEQALRGKAMDVAAAASVSRMVSIPERINGLPEHGRPVPFRAISENSGGTAAKGAATELPVMQVGAWDKIVISAGATISS